jgi:hypothetical protein
MIYKKPLSNSYIYKYLWLVNNINNSLIKSLNYKKIVVKIWDKFYLFEANTSDFSYKEIKEIYNKQQIYININLNKVSHDFLNDYRKLKKVSNYFEIEKKNLFKIAEKKVRNILNKVFIWNCLDIWCWDTLYKDIFTRDEVVYLWIDIYKVNNDLNIKKISFEDFNTKEKFDIIFFFRSINHFADTREVIKKAFSLLKDKWKLLIVENEAFWEVKFKDQIFEWKKGDYEHYFNYSLEQFKKVVENFKFNIIEEEEVNKNNANQWYICLQKK